MIPRQDQIDGADAAFEVLKKYGLVYLAWQERTGKTLTAILTAEKSDKVKSVLVVTKKNAVEGWNTTLKAYKSKLKFTVINYHSVDKAKGSYDFVILDEAHSYISGYPKTSMLWTKVYNIVYGLPIMYLSATPYAQGPQLLFHQLALSKWSPWRRFSDFYEWFKEFADRDKNGSLPTTRISPVQTVVDYKKVLVDKILAEVNHLFLTRSRADAGFEHEPEDVIHWIELAPHIKDTYNYLIKHRLIEFTIASGKKYKLICDTVSKLRYALHMLEGGTFKVDEDYVVLSNREKVDYILKTWGDTEDVVIMYNYKAEAAKLSSIFVNARLLQATSFAEGVDLSMHKHLIIYSQDFSTARHTQRRARQANMNREEEIKVHFLLVRKGLSENVYTAVSINKENFVDSLFEGDTL